MLGVVLGPVGAVVGGFVGNAVETARDKISEIGRDFLFGWL